MSSASLARAVLPSPKHHFVSTLLLGLLLVPLLLVWSAPPRVGGDLERQVSAVDQSPPFLVGWQERTPESGPPGETTSPLPARRWSSFAPRAVTTSPDLPRIRVASYPLRLPPGPDTAVQIRPAPI